MACARRKPVPFQERPGGVQHQTGRSRLGATLLQEGGQATASQTLLNKFFFYVLSRVSSWQCMTQLRVTTLDDVEALLLRSLLPPSGIEIWYGNAQSASCVQVLEKVACNKLYHSGSASP